MKSYVNPPYIFTDNLNWNFLWVTFGFYGIPYRRVEIQLLMMTIMLPFITNLIHDKFFN